MMAATQTNKQAGKKCPNLGDYKISDDKMKLLETGDVVNQSTVLILTANLSSLKYDLGLGRRRHKSDNLEFDTKSIKRALKQ